MSEERKPQWPKCPLGGKPYADGPTTGRVEGLRRCRLIGAVFSYLDFVHAPPDEVVPEVCDRCPVPALWEAAESPLTESFPFVARICALARIAVEGLREKE